MPLRATSVDGDLQAFEFNIESWAELKGSYKNNNLLMPCCQASAVPKTSPLGNFFFAHLRRDECTTAPESAEHLFCKALIAKSAAASGWTVTTEYAGESPDGEKWVADVFCEKGKAQVAFEVQMSPQTREEAMRRQAKYKASGVRAAWFYGQKLNTEVNATSRGLPLFGVGEVKMGVDPLIGNTQTSLTDFVAALLGKRVTWMRHSHTDPFYLATLRCDCRKCKRPAGLVFGYTPAISELPYIIKGPSEIDAAMSRLSKVITSRELGSFDLCHLLHVQEGRARQHTCWNMCPHCRQIVTNKALFSLLQAATSVPADQSGLESVYFDRTASDFGEWVLISDDGEYQPVSNIVGW